MPEENKESKEQKDQKEQAASPSVPAAKKANPFSDILERVAAAFISQENEEPQIKASTLEDWARRMARVGYEFTEETLKILLQYLKGYNLWIYGNVGVGKTYFFDCMNRIKRARGGEPIIKLSMIETQGNKPPNGRVIMQNMLS